MDQPSTWKSLRHDRSEVYIKRRETSDRMKYDKTLIRHYRPRSLFLFRTFFVSSRFLNEDKWSAGRYFDAKSNQHGGVAAESPIMNGPDVETFIANERSLCTPYWNVHHAWLVNVPKKSKNNWKI